MPFLFGILFFFASFQEEKVLSPFLGRGGSFYFYSSVLKRTRFLLCPPHPPPLFTHRRTGMGYNATATRFVRKNFVDQAGGNPSLLSIDLDQKLQEICVFLSVWGLFSLWDLSYHHYIYASIYVYVKVFSLSDGTKTMTFFAGLALGKTLVCPQLKVVSTTIFSTYMSCFQYLWDKNNCFRGFQEIWLDIPILSLQWHAKRTFLLVTTWGSKIKRSFLWRSFCCAKTWKNKQLQMITSCRQVVWAHNTCWWTYSIKTWDVLAGSSQLVSSL